MKDLTNLFNRMYKYAPNNFEKTIRKSLINIDLYKLSFTIMEIMEEFRYSQYNPDLVDKFYSEIIFPCLSISPRKRIKLSELLKRYKAFIDKLLQ